MFDPKDRTSQLFSLIKGISPNSEKHFAKITGERINSIPDYQLLNNGVVEFKKLLTEAQVFIEQFESKLSNQSFPTYNEIQITESLNKLFKELEDFSTSIKVNVTNISSNLMNERVKLINTGIESFLSLNTE
jgi:hypothetical protein